MLKVLGKEFEEEPFFKRVFLNITYKTAVRVSRLTAAFLLTFGLRCSIIKMYKYVRYHGHLLTVQKAGTQGGNKLRRCAAAPRYKERA
jgi:hypothetical protein